MYAIFRCFLPYLRYIRERLMDGSSQKMFAPRRDSNAGSFAHKGNVLTTRPSERDLTSDI